MSDVGHIVVYDTCGSPFVGLHHFYFAKLAQAASCKYHGVISAENSDTLSAFSSSRQVVAKENVVFQNFP